MTDILKIFERILQTTGFFVHLDELPSLLDVEPKIRSEWTESAVIRYCDIWKMTDAVTREIGTTFYCSSRQVLFVV